MVLTFQSIGLQGYSLGVITFKDDIIGILIISSSLSLSLLIIITTIEWKDRSNNQHTLNKGHISAMKWATYGTKASVHIIDADGKSIKFDGIIIINYYY